MKKNINISDVKINYPLLSKFPADFLIKNLFFPLEEKDGTISIAMPDPENLDKIGMIENFTQKKVLPYFANRGDLEKFLKKSDTYTKVLRDKTETFAVKKTVAAVEDDMVTIESITEEDDSVVKLLNNIILTAVSKKASDIHVEIQNAALIIKYRIDGILHQIMEPLDCSFHPFLMTRLKVISELDIAEKRVPQDGRFRMRFKQKTIDFRVSIMPGIYGENAVIRNPGPGNDHREHRRAEIETIGLRPLYPGKDQLLYPPALRPFPGHRPHRQRQDHHPVCRPERDQGPGRQDHHHRRPGRVPGGRHHPDPGQ
jgi:type II secretory ATPase GspE/PulE/Tfp pilus assembly ATPase PilB-like protein